MMCPGVFGAICFWDWCNILLCQRVLSSDHPGQDIWVPMEVRKSRKITCFFLNFLLSLSPTILFLASSCAISSLYHYPEAKLFLWNRFGVFCWNWIFFYLLGDGGLISTQFQICCFFFPKRANGKGIRFVNIFTGIFYGDKAMVLTSSH